MTRVLVANRGEIACRVLRTCKRLGFETAAVYSEADATAMHVSLADVAFPIGGAPPADSYLRSDRIVDAARGWRADAIHPGYGFLSENEKFARDVEAAGLAWIGPAPKTIEDMGDKERARLLAKSARIPVLPGSARFVPGATSDVDEAARAVGFPLLVKAAAGGGGIGMRRVDAPEDLIQALESTQAMAARAFGDGTVYLERFIAQARHVEVQVFGFGDGRAMHLHERDCSMQRRFQKIVEESPAPALSAATRRRMYEAALALCRQERYRSAGTIEFVVDADTEDFYFLEMNTRIQVEHPVTEVVTDIDLVEMQLALSAGQTPRVQSQDDVSTDGHAIECRLYAERPAKGFLPAPGPLKRFEVAAAAPWLRVDTGVRSGDHITHYYDPMIAKVIVQGADRAEAIARMLQALESIVIDGVETNLAFLKRALCHPVFAAGGVRTDFIQRHGKDLLA